MRNQILRRFMLSGIALVMVYITPVNGAAQNTAETEISGLRLRAASIALADFKKRPYDLAKYIVLIREKSGAYEVSFVPLIPAGEESIRGGENSNGKEINYLISQGWKIAKISYAK